MSVERKPRDFRLFLFRLLPRSRLPPAALFSPGTSPAAVKNAFYDRFAAERPGHFSPVSPRKMPREWPFPTIFLPRKFMSYKWGGSQALPTRSKKIGHYALDIPEPGKRFLLRRFRWLQNATPARSSIIPHISPSFIPSGEDFHNCRFYMHCTEISLCSSFVITRLMRLYVVRFAAGENSKFEEITAHTSVSSRKLRGKKTNFKPYIFDKLHYTLCHLSRIITLSAIVRNDYKLDSEFYSG